MIGSPAFSLSLVILALFTGSIHAQTFGFHVYGEEAGFANLATTALLTDREGFVWACTESGIYRYAGRRFEAIPHQDRSLVPGCRTLHQDPAGRVWAGNPQGVLLYRNGEMVPQSLEFGNLPGGGSDIVSGPNGELLVATSKGIAASTGPDRDGQFQFHLLPLPGVDSGRVDGLMTHPDGSIWAGCGQAICRLASGAVEKFDVRRGVPDENWSALLADSAGGVWARSRVRLIYKAPGTKTFEDRSAGVPDVALVAPSMTFDRLGRLLVPTRDGMAILESGRLKRMIRKNNGLPSSWINAVTVDHEGTPWVGTSGAGVARWQGYEEFEGYDEQSGLPGEGVLSITSRRPNEVWIATDAGLVQGRKASAAPWRYQLRYRYKFRFRMIVPTDAGSLWLVPENHPTLLLFDPESNRVREFNTAHGLPRDQIFSLFIDSRKGIWVATGSGLFYRPPTGPEAKFAAVVPKGVFVSLTQGAGGVIWAGATGWIYRIHNGAVSSYAIKTGNAPSAIMSMAEAPSGELLFVKYEGGGVHAARLENGALKIRAYTTKDGLATNSVYSVNYDRQGRLWVLHGRGVDLFDGSKFSNLSRATSLIWNDSNWNALHQLADGSVWVGSPRGLSIIHSVPKNEQLAPPKIVFASLGGIRREPVSPMEALAGTSALEVRFASLAYKRESQLEYSVRLEGLEQEWMPVAGNEFNIPRLQAGTYNFQLRVRAQGTDWSAPAELALRIEPQWWARWWARCLYLLGAMALVRAAFRIRTMRLEQDNLRLESQVEARTQEARRAVQAKTEFLANMSHEIRTPMNAIVGMTSLLLDSEQRPEVTERLSIIRSSADSLLTLINDILDISKIESGRLSLERREFNVDECVLHALRLISPAAFAKGLELVWEVAPDVPAAIEGDDTRLRQILINLVGNAVKFTAAGSIGLRVRNAQQASGVLEFCVWDTGIGIAKERQSELFQMFTQEDSSITRKYGGTGLGLAICKRLAEIMGGRIWVESEAGKGSSFYFTIAAPATRTRPEMQCDLSGRVLLIIAANTKSRQLLCKQMENWHAACVCVEGVAEAKAWLLAGNLADAAVIDCGIAMGPCHYDVEEWRELSVPIPTLVLSTVPLEIERFDLLMKPFGAEALRDALMRCLGLTSERARVQNDSHMHNLAVERPLRVLMVEDNRINQLVGRSLLQRMGYTPALACDGLDALRMLQQESFDVVFMDVQMPGMDGLEATRAIRALHLQPRPWIIAMTAGAFVEDRRLCLEAGMDDYISKPVLPAELSAALMRVKLPAEDAPDN